MVPQMELAGLQQGKAAEHLVCFALLSAGYEASLLVSRFGQPMVRT